VAWPLKLVLTLSKSYKEIMLSCETQININLLLESVVIFNEYKIKDTRLAQIWLSVKPKEP